MPSTRGRRTAVPPLHAPPIQGAPHLGNCTAGQRPLLLLTSLHPTVAIMATPKSLRQPCTSERSNCDLSGSMVVELAPPLPMLWPTNADLALHTLVKACHVDDHALVSAVADRLTLVACLDAEADGAPLDFYYLRRRNDGEPHRCRRKMAHVEPDPEALMPRRQEWFCRCQCGSLDQTDHHRGG